MRHRLLPLLLAALALNGCHRELKVFSYQEDLMHTRWDFSVVAADEALAKAAEQEAAALIHRLDGTLAMWQPQSELSVANGGAGAKGGAALSDDLAEVCSLALEAAKRSHGTFDPTVGPLTQAWYDARQADRLLGPGEIHALMQRVGWQSVTLTAGNNLGLRPRLRFLKPGMRLDFGGIAKGYAQDKAAALLRAHGLVSFLMNAGGQVYAAGHKPDGSAWRVGIVNPRDNAKLVAIVPLSDQVMATSGDYEQFKIVNGKRSHHLLDPRTGSFVDNGVASATSILPLQAGAFPATWADIHGKPVFVLGPAKGLAYLQAADAEGLIISVTPRGLTATATPGLRGLALQL